MKNSQRFRDNSVARLIWTQFNNFRRDTGEIPQRVRNRVFRPNKACFFDQKETKINVFFIIESNRTFTTWIFTVGNLKYCVILISRNLMYSSNSSSDVRDVQFSASLIGVVSGADHGRGGPDYKCTMSIFKGTPWALCESPRGGPNTCNLCNPL